MARSEQRPALAIADGAGKIRVLEILGNAIIGGMESTVCDLISNLPADAFEFTCICPYESAFTARLRGMGCQVYITAIRDDPPWLAIEFVTAIINRHQINIVHAHLLNAHTLGAIAARLAGRPIVATIHSMTLWQQELSVARAAGTHLITVCQQAYCQSLAAGIAPEMVSLIPNGVDLRRFGSDRNGDMFREQINVPDNVMLVGFVGRLAHEKGPDKFVLAAQSICDQNSQVHFVLVGEGPEESRLRQMVKGSGHDGRIHFAGAQGQMEKVYPAFDLLLQTSRSEAMPLALIEAMACNLPVVALAVGDVAAIIMAGETGIPISPVEWPGVASPYPGDWPGIAAATLELLDQPQRMARLGQLARARAVEMFDVRITAGKVAALFRFLLKEGAAKHLAEVKRIR
jgi:glycosyltransferase involved in cell wall biosynthesis